MEISIKERQRYRDISWLMPSIDVEDVLRRLGSRIARITGDEITAFCPDHHLFMGRESSHPKWGVNKVTGKTYCFTESRGSNLVWIVCRLLDCGTKGAVKFLTGLESDKEISALRLASAKQRIARLKNKDELEKPRVRLDEIRQGLEARRTSSRLYDFFIHPPGKKYSTDIQRETVDRYQVFEMTWGFYIDRAVIPFFSEKELIGHCSVDLLGEEAWSEKYPLQARKGEYRKTRYPANFPASEYLFGMEDCEKSPDLVIVTEGPREVMKLWQEGFQAVAILGSKIHTPQIRLLAQLAPKEVALMFDGDDAGWTATDRDAKVLSRLFKVLPCYLPVGRDPKNLKREEIQKLVKKS